MDDFVRINGASPFTKVPSFSHWRNLGNQKKTDLEHIRIKVEFNQSTCSKNSGILPDLLHICDLAIFCDLFAGAFMLWSDRETQLRFTQCSVQSTALCCWIFVVVSFKTL